MNRYKQLREIRIYLREKRCDLDKGTLWLHPWFMIELNEYIQSSERFFTNDMLKLDVQPIGAGYSWYYIEGGLTIFSFDGDDQKIARTKCVDQK